MAGYRVEAPTNSDQMILALPLPVLFDLFKKRPLGRWLVVPLQILLEVL